MTPILLFSVGVYIKINLLELKKDIHTTDQNN